MAKVQQKAVLICIDGWSFGSKDSPADGNAVLNAETPHMDGFAKKDSDTAQGYTELEASSIAVGLPEGLMGNSEVGHLNIGAGRVVWQDVVRIDQTIKNGELNKVENIKKSFTRAKEGNGRLHLLGLVSDGGVVRTISPCSTPEAVLTSKSTLTSTICFVFSMSQRSYRSQRCTSTSSEMDVTLTLSLELAT